MNGYDYYTNLFHVEHSPSSKNSSSTESSSSSSSEEEETVVTLLPAAKKAAPVEKVLPVQNTFQLASFDENAKKKTTTAATSTANKTIEKTKEEHATAGDSGKEKDDKTATSLTLPALTLQSPRDTAQSCTLNAHPPAPLPPSLGGVPLTRPEGTSPKVEGVSNDTDNTILLLVDPTAPKSETNNTLVPAASAPFVRSEFMKPEPAESKDLPKSQSAVCTTYKPQPSNKPSRFDYDLYLDDPIIRALTEPLPEHAATSPKRVEGRVSVTTATQPPPAAQPHKQEQKQVPSAPSAPALQKQPPPPQPQQQKQKPPPPPPPSAPQQQQPAPAKDKTQDISRKRSYTGFEGFSFHEAPVMEKSPPPPPAQKAAKDPTFLADKSVPLFSFFNFGATKGAPRELTTFNKIEEKGSDAATAKSTGTPNGKPAPAADAEEEDDEFMASRTALECYVASFQASAAALSTSGKERKPMSRKVSFASGILDHTKELNTRQWGKALKGLENPLLARKASKKSSIRHLRTKNSSSAMALRGSTAAYSAFNIVDHQEASARSISPNKKSFMGALGTFYTKGYPTSAESSAIDSSILSNSASCYNKPEGVEKTGMKENNKEKLEEKEHDEGSLGSMISCHTVSTSSSDNNTDSSDSSDADSDAGQRSTSHATTTTSPSSSSASSSSSSSDSSSSDEDADEEQQVARPSRQPPNNVYAPQRPLHGLPRMHFDRKGNGQQWAVPPRPTGRPGARARARANADVFSPNHPKALPSPQQAQWHQNSAPTSPSASTTPTNRNRRRTYNGEAAVMARQQQQQQQQHQRPPSPYETPTLPYDGSKVLYDPYKRNIVPMPNLPQRRVSLAERYRRPQPDPDAPRNKHKTRTKTSHRLFGYRLEEVVPWIPESPSLDDLKVIDAEARRAERRKRIQEEPPEEIRKGDRRVLQSDVVKSKKKNKVRQKVENFFSL